jgi:hypothetical protein
MARTITRWGFQEKLVEDIKHPDVIRCFTYGQCTSLARAIHEITKWQMILLADTPCNALWEMTAYGVHVVCQRPDGRFVDIAGAWEPNNPEWQRWNHHIPITERQVKNIGWDRQDIRAARFFVNLVMASL